MPKSTRFDTSSVIVETMRAAPGVPSAAKVFPSFRRIVGAIIVRIRLPGAMALGPREPKFFISLLRMIPVPPTSDLRAEEVGDRLGERDHVALCIDDGERGRARRLLLRDRARA